MRSKLAQAVEMGAAASRDLAGALGVVERAVAAARGAQKQLQSAAAEEEVDDEELQHLASTLRATVAESRRAQREGERVQHTARSQMNTTSFQISQAIAAERSQTGTRATSPRGRLDRTPSPRPTSPPEPSRTSRQRTPSFVV